jgi:DNA-binding MarR family transcriptional regulator
MGKKPPPPSIGFLLAVLSRRKNLAFRALLAPHGLTPPQFGVLAALSQQPGLPLGEVAGRLCVDQTSLSRTVFSMERAGLLLRRRNRSDRRVLQLHLSERGTALMAKLRPLMEAESRRLLRGVSRTEVAMLRRALTRMIDNLSADEGER